MNKLLLSFFCINIVSATYAQMSPWVSFPTKERSAVSKKPIYRNNAKLYAIARGENCVLQLGTQTLQYPVSQKTILSYAKLGLVVIEMPFATRAVRNANHKVWTDFIAKSLNGNVVETPYFELQLSDSALIWAQTQQKLTQILPNSEPLPDDKAELRALLREFKAELATLTPAIRSEEASIWQNLNTSAKPELWQKIAQLDKELYIQIADFEQNQNDKAAYAIADLTTKIQAEKRTIPANEEDYLGVYEQWQASRAQYYRLLAQIAHIERLLQNQK